MAVAAGAVASFVMLNGDPAAACSRTDGTVPGSSASVVAASAGGRTFYVDDRDVADLDADGEAGSIWIYEESNGESGLQRGGESWWYDAMPGICQQVGPTQVLAPDPDRPVAPNGITLFPDGFGGDCDYDHSYSDPCVDSVTPDRLWF